MTKLIDSASIDLKYPSYSGMDSVKVNLSRKNGSPVVFTTVYLYDQNKNHCFTQKKTDKNGVVIFDNIDKDFVFFVIAHDPTGEYNGVIADNIGGQNVDD